jgi:hypothetical protein
MFGLDRLTATDATSSPIVVNIADAAQRLQTGVVKHGRPATHRHTTLAMPAGGR